MAPLIRFESKLFYFLWTGLITCLLSGCLPEPSQKWADGKSKKKVSWRKKNPEPLSPQPFLKNSPTVVIQNAKIYTATGKVHSSGTIILKNGKIWDLSEKPVNPPKGAQVIDAQGMVVTPGLIDVHSHMGVYPSPMVDAHHDGNEMVRPNTADVWAEHGFWPQDPDLWRAVAGGTTMLQVLPGSGNLIGGRSFTTKLILKNSAREMRHPTAPQGLKMACGENPKRVHKKTKMMSRMGVIAGFRKAFQEAVEYKRKSSSGLVEKRDLVLETLSKVLDNEILVHIHCYRADDISNMLDIAKEFGFTIRTIQHGLEAYKIADRLAREQVGVATWADWWGFKAEAFDGIGGNAALLKEAGGKPIIHSDSAIDARFLNVEAAKAMVEGHKLGLKITEDEALQWITINAAWALGLDKETGSLVEGKDADVVIWDGSPFSIESKAQYVFINGQLVFDRKKNLRQQSDVEVGYRGLNLFDGRNFAPPQPPLTMDYLAKFPEKNTQNPMDLAQDFIINNVTAFIEGAWKTKTQILVTDGTIKAIDPTKTPEGIYTIDGSGRYLTPGFVQSRTTHGIVDIELDGQAQDMKADGIVRPDHKTQWSIDTSGPRTQIFMAQGVLNQIVAPRGGLISGSASAFQSFDGSPPTPPIAVFGDLKPYPHEEKGKSSKGHSWSLWEKLFHESSQFQKTGSAPKSNGDHFSTEVLKSFLPAAQGKIPLVIKANRAGDISNLIRFMDVVKSQYGFSPKLVIQGGSEAWKASEQLAKRSIPVMTTPSLQTPLSFLQMNSRFDLAARLAAKGVPLIINDSAEYGVPRIRQEAGVAIRYGLSEEKALKAITSTPAKVFGLKGGSLKEGAEASMTLWSAKPTEPTSQALNVWIKGTLQDLKTRRLLLGTKYLKKMDETEEEK